MFCIIFILFMAKQSHLLKKNKYTDLLSSNLLTMYFSLHDYLSEFT